MRRLLVLCLALCVAGPPAVAPAAKHERPKVGAKAKAKAKKRRAAKRRAALERRRAAEEFRRQVAQLLAAAAAPAAPAPPPAPEQPAAPTTEEPAQETPATPVVAVLPRAVSLAASEFALVPSRTLLGSGPVTVELRNVGEDPHDLEIDTLAGVQVALWDDLLPGDFGRPTTDVKTVALAPGTYRFYCTLPGHAAAGMDTQLTVAAAG